MASNRVLLSTLAIVGAAIPVPTFAATTTVKVDLADKGSGNMPTGFGMEMEGADKSMTPLRMNLQPAKVKSGAVTFDVANSSKELVHEMVIARVAAGATLPYDASKAEVKEDEADTLGEVEELDPGKHGALTLNLDPGDYVLFCNVRGHYGAGMWKRLTVEP
jgi:uncharacterized cupredoxin-like copper-binding protein